MRYDASQIIMIVMTIEIMINGVSNLLVHLCLIHCTNKMIKAANAGISKMPTIIIIKLPNPAASPDIIKQLYRLSKGSKPSKR